MNDVFCGSFPRPYAHNDTRYNDVKEGLSHAYLAPICAYIGATLEIKTRMMDNKGIDATVELPPGEGRPTPLRLDIQFKSTSSPELDPKGRNVRIPIRRPIYEGMTSPLRTNPWLLFVLILPDDVSEWVTVEEKELIQRSTMLWCDAGNCDAGDGEEHVTLAIPLTNRVNIESLSDLLIKQMEC